MWNITVKYKNCFVDFFDNVEGFNICSNILLMWDSQDSLEMYMDEIQGIEVELVETSPLYPKN